MYDNTHGPDGISVKPDSMAHLRSRAASRLTGGAAGKGAPATAADALSVLHALASAPETAADALALLHELQVHQVELDLQAQDLRDARNELEAALRQQSELYEHQPVGCLRIDHRLGVLDLNPAAAAMLGIRRDLAFGLPLVTFLATESGLRWRVAMASLAAARAAGEAAGPNSAPTLLELRTKDGPAGPLLATIAEGPNAGCYLVNLTALTIPLQTC